MIGLEAPGVEADGDIEGERVGAGEIEVDQPGEPVAQEEHVVGKQIGVDDALRQVAWPAYFEMVELRLDGRAHAVLYAVGPRRGLFEQRPPARDRERVAPRSCEIRP